LTGPRRTVDIGRAAEEAAAQFLRKQGLREIGRNFRCHGGEIDLIMRHGDWLVFVEVRYRSSQRFGSAAESVATGKRRGRAAFRMDHGRLSHRG
jgi:putative endonuclease